MAQVIKQWYEEAVDVERLRPHPKNAKLHDLDAIGGSIAESGFGGAIYAQASTSYVLAGHGTLEAAIQQGMTTVPVLWLDVDDAKAENLLIAFNAAQEKAGYDDDLLADLLRGVAERGDYAAAAYSPDDVDDFLAAMGGTIVVPPPDDGFRGGYADDASQRQGAMPTGTTQQRGLREMVVVLDAADYEELMELQRIARGRFGADTTSVAILQAMREWRTVTDE